MRRVLIIKLGAMGDVLRTTPILRELNGEITWVTHEESIPLIAANPYITRIIPSERCEEIRNINFDLVLNLDDDIEAAQIVFKVQKSRLVGAYMNADGRLTYTEDAAKWFDMGLISKYGLTRANELKKLNKRTYQEFLFEMLGFQFRGQEYLLPRPKNQKKPAKNAKIIGVETQAGERWHLKKWDKYDELIQLLVKDGYNVKVFNQRDTLLHYIDDIDNCELLVTGDTLCMHIGIALEKKVIAIFGPTSAEEIYDYGRVYKIVSPLDCVKCYKRECIYNPNCMQVIPAKTVYEKIKSLI